MAERRSLADVVRKQEAQENESSKTRSAAVNRITPNDGSKDKQISAKVNAKMYEIFTRINKEQGISNNSALNMIISRYVRENKGILDDESVI